MAEYIKRETAVRAVMAAKWVDGSDGAMAMEIVMTTPAADAVPVVRCKDCKYYKSGKLLYPNKFCFRLKHPTENRAIGYNFGPDDFCSYGERKDVRETFFPEDVEA